MRALVGVLEIWILPFVAILSCLASSRSKRVGDFLAGTVVVRERVPQSAAPLVQMPPSMAGWAATAELSRLPDQLALAARQFLSRAAEHLPGRALADGSARRLRRVAVRSAAPAHGLSARGVPRGGPGRTTSPRHGTRPQPYAPPAQPYASAAPGHASTTQPPQRPLPPAAPYDPYGFAPPG